MLLLQQKNASKLRHECKISAAKAQKMNWIITLDISRLGKLCSDSRRSMNKKRTSQQETFVNERLLKTFNEFDFNCLPLESFSYNGYLTLLLYTTSTIVVPVIQFNYFAPSIPFNLFLTVLQRFHSLTLYNFNYCSC